MRLAPALLIAATLCASARAQAAPAIQFNGPFQPSAAQPSAAQPSAAQPSAAQPNAAQPGTAKAGNVPALAPEQQAMFAAAQHVLAKQWAQADALYSQAIAQRKDYTDAYLQRAVVRREMGNAPGMEADAVMAIRLADMQIRQQPNAPKLYYQRGTGYRLLKRFPQAKADMEQAIALSGRNSRWKSDLQAIRLEEKIAAGTR